MIWLIIIWFAFIMLEVARNFWMIQKGDKPNYLQSFILRGMAAIGHGILYNPADPREWLPLLIFQVASFYLIFDFVLNLLRGKHFDYQGKTSGWLDKLPKQFYYALKLVCLIALVCTSIILL